MPQNLWHILWHPSDLHLHSLQKSLLLDARHLIWKQIIFTAWSVCTFITKNGDNLEPGFWATSLFAYLYLLSVQEIVQDETEEALTDIARRRIADTTKMD